MEYWIWNIGMADFGCSISELMNMEFKELAFKKIILMLCAMIFILISKLKSEAKMALNKKSEIEHPKFEIT